MKKENKKELKKGKKVKGAHTVHLGLWCTVWLSPHRGHHPPLFTRERWTPVRRLWPWEDTRRPSAPSPASYLTPSDRSANPSLSTSSPSHRLLPRASSCRCRRCFRKRWNRRRSRPWWRRTGAGRRLASTPSNAACSEIHPAGRGGVRPGCVDWNGTEAGKMNCCESIDSLGWIWSGCYLCGEPPRSIYTPSLSFNTGEGG